MKRRRLIAALGGVIAGGSTIFSTSAFTSVSAERSVSVSVADDDRAFLRLEPLANRGIDGDSTLRSFSDGRTVGFEIPGNGGGENPNAEGVGLDSVYEFHDLLEVSNQGTQPVQVRSTYNGDNFADLALVNDNGVLKDDPPKLSVGENINVGFIINTHGSEIGEFNETLTIVADQPDD
jgi:hypothetical protein